MAVSAVTDTELGYLDGVTSAIQTQINGKQATLTYNAPSSNNGNPSTSAQIQSALNGKQNTLTFGIANTNAVKVDHGSVTDDDYARFTANGLEGRSTAEVKTDLGLPSNCLTEANSIYIGSDPSSSTDTTNGNASSNIAVGVQAMDAVTTGKENIAIGYQSLTNNTTGNSNTAIGHQAARDYTGSVITAIGYDCLIQATGVNNTGVGAWALTNCVGGTSNTAVGYNAGNVITSGSDNVIIGYLANPSGATGTNEIVIGQNVTGQGNNKAVIGNNNITDVYMARDSGATVHCGGLTVGANSVVGTQGAAVADCSTAIAADGAIAALSSSTNTTQGQFNALKDECEKLRDAVAELQTQLNQALARMRAHGLIAT